MNAQLRRSRDVDQGVEATLLPNWIKLPVGFSVLVLSVAAGEQIKSWLHLPIPGNVLGLSILVLCFRLRLIQPALIKEAASRLLYLLPALFIPVFVSAVIHVDAIARRIHVSQASPGHIAERPRIIALHAGHVRNDIECIAG